MSIISGIFPSEILDIDESGLPIYDRAVDEEYFAKYHSEFLSNGVYANPSNNFQVMVNDLMKLKVKAGSCFINGYYAYDNFDGEIILEPASSDLDRIDRIVARLDRINRKISIEVKKGAYGTASYSAPDLQRDDDIWELGLADVLVKKGTTQIVQANITDLRPIQEYCGYVYNPMQNIDTTDLFAQYDNSFEVWFQHVKDQLSTDAAGNLQKQIDTHTSELADFMNFLNNGGDIGTVSIYNSLANLDNISTSKRTLSWSAKDSAEIVKTVALDAEAGSFRQGSTPVKSLSLGDANYPWNDLYINRTYDPAISKRTNWYAIGLVGTCASSGETRIPYPTGTVRDTCVFAGGHYVKSNNVANPIDMFYSNSDMYFTPAEFGRPYRLVLLVYRL